MVLSIDVSYFVACSRIFRGQSPPAATSRLFGSRINAEDDIMPKVTSESASGRGLINLMLFSKISFSLLLMFFWGRRVAQTRQEQSVSRCHVLSLSGLHKTQMHQGSQ
ncbi:uncharacterized protein CTRU02_215742 [Colletotrichum truncatum]|uniref:Uncharacterized protein n=1 Tax=Colletotrichum truncatum TaxID=5467 RepID=A0ACC3YBR4_COLTU|nr:uncharacterized protein CTRU02_15204 [Colletotrichum truncatum]KAF6781314.1 hypothetical protein CTRU02_15204 [Colletotrichum truncatum]